ncbi:MAG: hypothetical protein ACR2NF_09260, partial [Pirellulales bacterium]
MSFLATLFSQSRFERKPRKTASQREVVKRLEEIVARGAALSLSRRKYHTPSLSDCEKLEPRIALSVNTIVRENFQEVDYRGQDSTLSLNEVPGLVTVASDDGSDVYMQQLETDPTELLVADNGSFLDYTALEMTQTVAGQIVQRYDEIFVTNGSVKTRRNVSIIQEVNLHPDSSPNNEEGFDNYLLLPDTFNDYSSLRIGQKVKGTGIDDDVFVTGIDPNNKQVGLRAGAITSPVVTTANDLTFTTSIAASSWWLFPSRNDVDKLTSTKIALNRPNIFVGVLSDGPQNSLERSMGGTADLFGSIKLRQGDDTISEWDFSSWNDQSATDEDFIQVPGDDSDGESLHITSGPGFGGRARSFQSRAVTPVEKRSVGYIFPKDIYVQCEGAGQDRRYYLVCDWSQTPTVPPIIEVNYVGAVEDSASNNQNIERLDYREQDIPTRGVAANTTNLEVIIPDSITSGASDGAPSLGIVPGTLSGTIHVGGEDTNRIFSTNFNDRVLSDGSTTLFFENINSGVEQRRHGRLLAELSPRLFTGIDRLMYENHGVNRDQDREVFVGISGQVREQSSVAFELAGYNQNNLAYGSSARSLNGVNVELTEASLLDGSAVNAVRVTDLEYLIFVKPTTTNDVVFAPGATITRNVTVDLLAEGSSIFVNSEIDIEGATGDIDFRATNIHINAPTETNDYVFLGRSESTTHPRLPRESNPQGGTQVSPTFGVVVPDTVRERTVTATPILSKGGIDLVVLPGDEGYGYDPNNPQEIKIDLTQFEGSANAEASVVKISGGVDRMTIGSSGSGYGTGEVPVTFTQPQLRRVEQLRTWSGTDENQGYVYAAPVMAISQPNVVASEVRIGYGERARSQAVTGHTLDAITLTNGSNYTSQPTIKIQLTAAAKAEGISFFDEEIPDHFRHKLETPVFDAPLRLNENSKTVPVGKASVTTSTYKSGDIGPLTVTTDGWGLNFDFSDEGITLEDLSTPAGLDAVRDRFEIVATGGSNMPPVGVPADNYVNYPSAAERVDATFEISEAILGSLRWLDEASGEGALLSAGKNYTLGPTVQFVSELSAKAEKADAVPEQDVPSGVTLISLNDVAAFRDGSARPESQLPKQGFRDIDYLSYINDSLFADKVVARVSIDGEDWHYVQVKEFTGLDKTSNYVDVLTAQLGVSEIPTVNYPGGFQSFIDSITEAEIYFDQTFAPAGLFPAAAATATITGDSVDTLVTVDFGGLGYARSRTDIPVTFSAPETGVTATGVANSDRNGVITSITVTNPGSGYSEAPIITIDAPPVKDTPFVVETYADAYAIMGYDEARGRAVASDGEITNIEVTYSGSGFTEAPTPIFGGGGTGATATVFVSGGIYEIEVDEAGFNYDGVQVAGEENYELLLASQLPVYDLLTGMEPIVDFRILSSAIQGGTVRDPGTGIEIVGAVITNANYTELVIAGSGGFEDPLQPAIFEAIVQPNGVVNSFKIAQEGKGYSVAPTVVVSAPPSGLDATAKATIDASKGIVTSIDPVEKGNRYKTVPKVVVRPPNPRGEGVAATAEAVLDSSGKITRIVVNDGGSGYTAPPEVIIEKRFDFARTEFVDVASRFSAPSGYEMYITHSDFTSRERGQLLLRPEALLGDLTTPDNRTEVVYVEASTSDLVIEGDVKSDEIMVIMQSRKDREMLSPFTVSTRSRATGQQSGTIHADTLALTLGNDIPTPQVGSSLTNTFDVRTQVERLRVTAAESVADPRGAFPYELSVTEIDNLIIDAVPRSGGAISFEVGETLNIEATVQTDGDVSVKAQVFDQSSPVITETGRISIEANKVTVNNSLQVLSAPLDPDRVDILLTATQGAVELVGLIEAPNAIEIRQSEGKTTGVTGASRLTAERLRIRADGPIDVATDVQSMVGFSSKAGIRISEIDDINFENLAASNGSISLTAEGVDRGGESTNPIALTARILEASTIIVSAPNGSMDIRVDSSDDIEIGDQNAAATNSFDEMKAAGNVRITSSAGNVDVFDGPVAGAAARQVRAATTGPLNNRHTYQGNSPGSFPSTLSGEGPLPSIDGVALEVGDRILVKDQVDLQNTDRVDESRENGIYVVKRLGGGASGFRDWLLTRAVSEDTRAELLPGSFVRVAEGATLAGAVVQAVYANVPELRVTRTENSQLVVAGSTGSLLNLDLNNSVTGDGIIPGARVTGIDFNNG